MGQLVVFVSVFNSILLSLWVLTRSFTIYLCLGVVGRTLVCCKIQGKYINSGERPIKLSYSWFFAKAMLVVCQ